MTFGPAQLPIEDSTDTVEASSAKTATGNSAVVNTYGPLTAMVIQVNVTAASGVSPTLDVDLEDSIDGVTWNKVADVNAANITAASVTVKRINLIDTPVAPRLRFKWTIAGTTPAFTFDVKTYSTRQ